MKKILGKLPVLFSILYLAYMNFSYSIIIIPELNIYLSWSLTMQISYIIIFGWYLLPIKKYFRCDGLLENLYYIVPFMFMCNILFAQYHVIWACIIILAQVVVLVKYKGYLIVRKSKSKRENNTKKVYARKCVIFMTMLLIGPSVYMVIKTMKAPSYSGLSYYLEDENLSDENYQLKQLLECNKSTLLNCSSSKWSKLSEQEKINVLKTIADIESVYLGIEKVEVVTENMQYATYSSFDQEYNMIRINRYYLDDSELALQCIFHEVFHAYQLSILDYIYIETDENKRYSSYYGDIRNWNNEMINYTNDYKNGYYVQSVEVSARNYSSQQMEIYKEFFTE